MNLLLKWLFVYLLGSATLSLAATPPAGLSDNVVSCQSGPSCFNRKMFGRDYKVLRTPRAEIMVSISTEGIYTRADISITNYDSLPASITPDDFRVEVVVLSRTHALVCASRSFLRRGSSQILWPKPQLQHLPLLLHRLRVPLSRPQTRLILSILMSSTRRRRSRWRCRKQPIAPQRRRNLAPGTLKVNQVTRGRAYFERDKKATQVMLTIPIAGVV